MKGKASEKWGKLSLYSKIVAVALFAFILLCLVAFLFGKTAAGIIAILQIVLTVVAVLMKKQTIKTSKNWLHFVVLALAVILLIPYVDLLSMEHSAAKDAERFSWPEILLAEVIPEPKSNLGEIFRNSEESLVLYVYKTSAADYSRYVDACGEKGFAVEAEQTEMTYSAFNADGYELSLFYDASDEVMNISVDAAKQYGTLVWPDSGMANMIPVPKSTTGEIVQDDEKGFAAYISNIPIEEFPLMCHRVQTKASHSKLLNPKNHIQPKTTMDINCLFRIKVTV